MGLCPSVRKCQPQKINVGSEIIHFLDIYIYIYIYIYTYRELVILAILKLAKIRCIKKYSMTF